MKKQKFLQIIRLVGLLVAIVVFCTIIPPISVKAATGHATVGSVSGEVGTEVTVSLTLSADTEMGGAGIILSYDPSSLEFVSGSDMTGGGGTITAVYSDTFTSINKSFKMRIKKTGRFEISVIDSIGATEITGTSYMISMENDEWLRVAGTSGIVTGTAPVTYSTDNNLSSLSISPGVLSPAFSPNVTTYTTSVDADCSQLVVSAVARDSNATVSVSGTKMDPGDNTTTIRVTAQNGAVKTYTIYTNKAQDNTEATEPEGTASGQTVKISDVTYKIVTDFELHPLPSGYEIMDYDYNDVAIRVGQGVNTKLILMYLESTEEGAESGFYIYDAVTKEFTKYMEISQPEVTYVILPITDSMEKPTGLTLTDYNINEMAAQVMMSSDRSYCVFYGVSSTGVTGWFRYDCKDQTIQRYHAADSITTSTEEVESNISYKIWQWIAVGTSLLAILLLITVIVLIAKISKNKKLADLSESEYDVYSSEDDLEKMHYNEDEELEDILNTDEETEELELFDLDDKN